MSLNEIAHDQPVENGPLYSEKQDHTAVDYALHILFTQFVRLSEQKISFLSRYHANEGKNAEPVRFNVGEQEAILLLKKGEDNEFDRCIQALVALASSKPVAVIESLLCWRKVRVDITSSSGTPRVVNERRSSISIYILCRVLTEIAETIPSNALEESTVSCLLECVFHQLLSAKNLPVSSSYFSLANWESFAFLVGSMSRFNFVMVSDRFIEEIEHLEKSGCDSRQKETVLVHLLRAMRYLRLQLYPTTLLEESIAFLQSLTSFFMKANTALKIEYAYLMEQLLRPLISRATFEVNIPAWSRTIETIYPVVLKMCTKTKYWNVFFPFCCTLLCLSPKQFFLKHWISSLDAAFFRVKDRRLRNTGLPHLSRVVWTYSNQYKEEPSIMNSNISNILKSGFSIGKKFSVVPFATLEELDGYAQIVRVVGAHFPELVIKEILTPLSTDAFTENIGPEKLMIVVRSVYYILHDMKYKKSDSTIFEYIEFEFVDLHEVAVGTPLQQFVHNLSQKLLFLVFQLSTNTNCYLDSKNATSLLALYINALKVFPCLMGKLEQRVIDAYVKCLNCSNKIIHTVCHNSLIYFSSGLKMSKSVISCLSRKLVKGSEYLLRTYHEVIRIWISQQEAVIEKRNSVLSNKSCASSESNTPASVKQDYDDIQSWTIIEEIQSLGVLHLSSPSVGIRKFAVALLNDVKQLNTEYLMLSSDKVEVGDIYSEPTIVDVLKDCDSSILSVESHLPTAAERSRLRKFINDGTKDMLLKLATSNSGVDISIWYNVFPRFIKVCFERFPTTMALLRNTVCEKLPSITMQLLSRIESSELNFNLKSAVKNDNFPEFLLVQWKLYLIVACCTITYTSNVDYSHTDLRRTLTAVQSGNHLRGLQETIKITSAESLFSMVLPLIFTEFSPIREAVVFAIGCINVNAFPQLVRSLKPYISVLKQDHQEFIFAGLNFPSVKRRNKPDLLLRSEIAHIFAMTSHLLLHELLNEDREALSVISEFLKDLKGFLSTPNVQADEKYLKLRCYFSQLLEKVLLVQNLHPSSEVLPFSGRASCWKLLDEWTGFGPARAITKNREELMRAHIRGNNKDIRERDKLLASFEAGKQNLEYLAIKAMIALCTAKLQQELTEGVFLFDIEILLNWFTAVFGSPSKAIVGLARKGLTALLLENSSNEVLLQKVINRCFSKEISQTISNYYFLSLSEMLIQINPNNLSKPKLLPLCLVNLSTNNLSVRLKAFELLGNFHLNNFTMTALMEFKTFLESSNPALYLKPQYLFSVQLASDFTEDSFTLTSECLRYFNYGHQHRRGLVTVLLPWLQNLELKMDVENKTFDSFTAVILIDLIEVTAKFTNDLPNEIEALWTSLALSRHKSNWTVILFFLMQQCYQRKTFSFVDCTRQITIYLAKTELLSDLYSTLLSFVCPANVSNENQEVYKFSLEDLSSTYVANLEDLFPSEKNHISYSPCQLSLLLLMDILPNPSIITVTDDVATILHAAFIQFDHYSRIVQEQCQQIFQYVVRKVLAMEGRLDYDDAYFDFNVESSLITGLRGKTKKEDDLVKYHNMILKTIELLSSSYPELKQIWGEVALSWATTCPSRRLACNSFQLFRSLLPDFDARMLLEIISRLVGTISDETSYLRDYSVEILRTFNSYVLVMNSDDLLSYSQILWTAIACLTTIHEDEFIESVKIAYAYFLRVEETDSATQQIMETFPQNWVGDYQGLQILILKGFRSTNSFEITMNFFLLLMDFKDNDLVGVGYLRILSCLLVSLPAMVYTYEHSDPITFDLSVFCHKLATLASQFNDDALIELLDTYLKRKFRSIKDFLKHTVSYLYSYYFEDYELEIVSTLTMFLSNNLTWFRKSTLDVLKELFPLIDFQKPIYSEHGLGIVSPLLRLLPTGYAMEALSLLTDSVLHVSAPTDMQTLKLLMVDPKLKNSDDRLAGFFEIPDEDGWYEPNSEYAAAITKSNVHAVFYSCSTTEASVSTPEVRFHADEVSNYPRHVPTDSHGSLDENSLGELVTTLHSLDVFFAEDRDEELIQPDVAVDPKLDITSEDYDDRIATILSGSLRRQKQGLMAYETESFRDYSPNEEIDASAKLPMDMPPVRVRKSSFISKLKPHYFMDAESYYPSLKALGNSAEHRLSLDEIRGAAELKQNKNWNSMLDQSVSMINEDSVEDHETHENYYHLRTMFQGSESNESFTDTTRSRGWH
ncbi:morphogenesis protein Mor2 [Schizosaccharomyces pombe]|uniref:Cell polarity protein mor2 n=1 Tax=Schizosaccharomyces pombe (strain 972 / ATCC 24843) TaxID=284812 RepID=MOR2_SCHPO|nr:morphogenesis protein Mor2 [Schizosaccharomyces pombe]Q9HDV6.1 RecName: Full=Cell polarity protein mor2; AltName: Full=Morphological round protein 2 [Schizosaccharomyces pombe 972h-]BAC20935.1 hypothetical protein [Schizosaccharomyces pombe]CAC19754.1 morphogenesis protein Mor2 [Schizosaccharomyces pombe]|eukprot:NP_596172.1 morphogenesis protein Mor2 [Schizosaccharomyces pombe]